MVTPINRREFLAISAGLVLAACGNDDGDADVAVTRRSSEDDKLSVVLGIDPNNSIVAGVEERVPFAVLKGMKPTSEHEAEVGFAKDGGEFGASIKVTAHTEGIEQRPYYVVRQTFPEPGTYRLGVNVGGGSVEAAFRVLDAASSKTPVPGRAFPAVKTPTVADQMGVNPICTRSPACPWHAVSLDAALAEKRPVVLNVGTPARCATQTCGPVLDVLLSQRDAFESKVRFVHAEVYTTLTGQETLPVISELGLTSEPWTFLIGADGVVRDRLAGPIDRREAAEALAKLVA